MKREVIRSLDAQNDMFNIWVYVAKDNLIAADKLIDRFEEKFRFISENPLAGRNYDELKPGLRVTVEGYYAIFYKLLENGDIVIVNIIHTNRNINRLF